MHKLYNSCLLAVILIFNFSCNQRKVEVEFYEYNPHKFPSPTVLKDIKKLKNITYKKYSIPVHIQYLGHCKENKKYKMKEKSMNITSDCLSIKGFACDFPNLDSPKDVYALLGDTLFRLNSQKETPQLAKRFGISKFDKCGFEGVIPFDASFEGKYSLTFIFVNKYGGFYYVKNTMDQRFPQRIVSLNILNGNASDN